MTNPIRVDMGAEDNGLGEKLMEAMLTGRPLVMFDSNRPELGEVGMGLDVELAAPTAAEVRKAGE
ncbi:hypothetical protein [Streptomyces antimycoticus]|uniref:hypothetical protein n=1 Tax=Streptomyces antimycoticus TaxID=68175 RepID=UPI0036E038C8